MGLQHDYLYLQKEEENALNLNQNETIKNKFKE